MGKVIIRFSNYFNINECFTKLSIISFGVVLIVGLIWGSLLVRENNLVKKLNGKFLHKYITLFILLCTIISALSTGVIQFINKNILGYMIWITLFLATISLEWAFIHEKISLISYYPNNENLTIFFNYFANKKISHIKYIEIVTWLSWWIHHYFRFNNQQDEMVDKLELLLRPGNNGLCLAINHKSDFIQMCKNICKCNDDTEILISIIKTYNIICSKEKEKYRLIHNLLQIMLLDKNILWYILIAILHIIGCILIGETPRLFIGNLLLYLPGDALLLLIYFGIVKQKKGTDFKFEKK